MIIINIKSNLITEKNKVYLRDFLKEISKIESYCDNKIVEISERVLKKIILNSKNLVTT